MSLPPALQTAAHSERLSVPSPNFCVVFSDDASYSPRWYNEGDTRASTLCKDGPVNN